ncbi:MAG: hypothetical protein IJ770_04435 [Alphaproteobacteria bacterium]|nr:hypothetical protein [Alphaproteobacteria bacterium]
MKQKIIICLAVCFLFSAIDVLAQKTETNAKSIAIELIIDKTDSVNCRIFYGLSKNGKEILPAKYDFLFNEDVMLFVFYDKHNLYIYDIYANRVMHKTFELPLDKDSYVGFEQVRDRIDVQCYELRVYFFNSSWGSEGVGTFFFKDGHTYRLENTPRIIQIN